MSVRRPLILFNEPSQSDRPSRFVTVDAGGDIDRPRRIGRGSMIAAQFISLHGAELFRAPMVSKRSGVEFAQILRDVKSLAMISSLIQTQPFHAR